MLSVHQKYLCVSTELVNKHNNNNNNDNNNKKNNKSHPGKGIAVRNNYLAKTPFVSGSCCLLEWWATCFGDRRLLAGVLEHEQLHGGRGGGWSWPTLRGPLRGFSRSPGGGELSAHPVTMGTPDFWGKATPSALMLPYTL